jgi:hypothetical protein
MSEEDQRRLARSAGGEPQELLPARGLTEQRDTRRPHAPRDPLSHQTERSSMKKNALVLTAVLGSSVLAGDWPAWRGPTGQGLSEEKNLALKWSDKGP